MNYPSVTQVADWHNKVVLLRAGLNVPVGEAGEILDDFRLERSLPSINYLRERGAKVVVMAHIGREETESLKPVSEYLGEHFPVEFKEGFFVQDGLAGRIEELEEELGSAEEGRVWLLDNLRASSYEKANDADIAKLLSGIADSYVNEAFSVSHRSHMSLDALARACKECYLGLAYTEELDQLSLALDPPKRSIAIISGNKFETKLPLIERFLKEYQTVVVGGALANTLYKLLGHEIGKSIHESDFETEVEEALKKIAQKDNLYLPHIVIAGKGNGEKVVKTLEEIESDDYIYDCAPESLIELEETVRESRLLVWNGPLGYYEGGYTEGTQKLLEMAVESSTQSILGGGNTVDAARDLGFQKEVTFLSTGGGAMIEFLSSGTLPALEAISDSRTS